MNQDLIKLIDNDFKNHLKLTKEEKNILVDYITKLESIVEIEILIENLSNVSNKIEIAELLSSLINLWTFLIKKEDLEKIEEDYYNNIGSLKKLFDISTLKTIFNENNNFISSIKLSYIKDNLYNKIIKINTSINLREFWINSFLKTIDLNIKYNDNNKSSIVFSATIDDLESLKTNIDNAINKLKLNKITNYNYYE